MLVFHDRLVGMLAVLACMVAVAGCGSSDIAPVTGVVTLGGEPVADAVVTFFPADNGKISSGQTDAEGRFTLTTQSGDSERGAQVGANRVSVVAIDVAAGPAPQEGDLGSLALITNPQPRTRSRIPEKYGVSATSGLEFEVEAGKSNVANFELTR